DFHVRTWPSTGYSSSMRSASMSSSPPEAVWPDRRARITLGLLNTIRSPARSGSSPPVHRPGRSAPLGPSNRNTRPPRRSDRGWRAISVSGRSKWKSATRMIRFGGGISAGWQSLPDFPLSDHVSLRRVLGDDPRQGAILLQGPDGGIECLEPPQQIPMQPHAQLGAMDRRAFLHSPARRLQLRIHTLQIAPLQAVQDAGLAAPLSDPVDQRPGIGPIVAL